MRLTNISLIFIVRIVIEAIIWSHPPCALEVSAEIFPSVREDGLLGNKDALRSRIKSIKSKQIDLYSATFPELQKNLAASFVEATEYLECIQFCSPSKRTITLGRGGGFGSMFQLAAKEFLQIHVQDLKNTPPSVRFIGDFKWYTNNSGCEQSGFRCFFRPETAADRSGICNKECYSTVGTIENNVFWWGVFQAYMFRPNAKLVRAAHDLRRQFKFVGFPDIALHIRAGDKSIDKGSRQNKAISPKKFLKLAERWSEAIFRSEDRRVLIYIATDSKEVQKLVRAWAFRHSNTMQIVMQVSNIAEKYGSRRKRNIEAAKAGWSISNSDKFEEALTFVLDLHFMMHAKYFAGLCMSQPARLAVNIGFMKGSMFQAVALDEQNIEYSDKWKYGRSEGWSRPSDIL